MGMKDYLYLESDGSVKAELEDLYKGRRYITEYVPHYSLGSTTYYEDWSASQTWWLAYYTGRTNISGESNGNVRAVPGKVIYERVNSVTTTLVTDTIKYKAFKDNAVNVNTIEFNFGIESMVPPTNKKGANDRTTFLTQQYKGNAGWQSTLHKGVLYYSTESRLESTFLIGNYYDVKFFRENKSIYKNTNDDTFFTYYDNDIIDKISVRIRYIIDTRYNPWEDDNFVELGVIEIPTSDLSPAQRENLNDTNRRKWDIDSNSFKGYGDNTIKIVSDGCTKDGTFWYINSESEKRPIKWVTSIPTDKANKIKQYQNIDPSLLLKGYIYGNGNMPVYYLTIVPEVDPIKWYEAGGLSANSNYPSGYMDLGLHIPVNRNGALVSGVGKISNGTETIGKIVPAYDVISDELFVGNFGSFNSTVRPNSVKTFAKSNWWGPTKTGSLITDKLDSEITNKDSPAFWINIARKLILKTSVESDASKYSSKSFSQNDKNLPSWVFRTYGINTAREITPFIDGLTTIWGRESGSQIGSGYDFWDEVSYSNYGSTSTGFFLGLIVKADNDIWRLPKAVIKWIVAEHHAWFRPAKQTMGALVLDVDMIKANAVSYQPKFIMFSEPSFSPIIQNTSDPLYKKVTIRGGFYYDKLDFYTSSDVQPQIDYANSINRQSDATAIQTNYNNNYLGKPKIITDLPKRYGILWKLSDSKSWTQVVFSGSTPLTYQDYISDLTNYELNLNPPTRENCMLVTPIGVGNVAAISVESDKKPDSNVGKYRRFSFQYDLPDLYVGKSYDVIFWVETSEVKKLSTNSTDLEKKYSQGYKIYFTSIGSVLAGIPDFNSFEEPKSGGSPFWFQMYKGWTLNLESNLYKDVNSAKRYDGGVLDYDYYYPRWTIFPFNTRYDKNYPIYSRNEIDFIKFMILANSNFDIPSIYNINMRYRPVHYYHNKQYKGNKNYQFRIVVENYYGSITLKNNKGAAIQKASEQTSWQGIEHTGYSPGYKKDVSLGTTNTSANVEPKFRVEQLPNQIIEVHNGITYYLNNRYSLQFNLFDLWSDEPILPDSTGKYNYWEVEVNGSNTPIYVSRSEDELIRRSNLIPPYENYTKVYKFKSKENALNYNSNNGNYLKFDNTTIVYKTIMPLKLITPWSDFIDINPPIIPAEVFRGGTTTDQANYESIRKMNLYGYANINSFNENNIRINYISLSASNVFNLAQIPNKPLNSFESSSDYPKNPLTISANTYFNGFSKVIITELDWDIQGYASFNMMTASNFNDVDNSVVIEYTNPILQSEIFTGRGWHYVNDSLIWVDYVSNFNDKKRNDVSINTNFPMGGIVNDYYSNKESNIKYLYNNFISRIVTYERYNLTFDYRNSSDFNITMYIGTELPEPIGIYSNNLNLLIESGKVFMVGKFGKSVGQNGGLTQSCEFIGLKGNQYLFFVADPIVNFNSISSGEVIPGIDLDLVKMGFKSDVNYTYNFSNGMYGKSEKSIISISNVKITYGYEMTKNNKLISVKGLDYSYKETGVTFSVKFGFGNNVFKDSPTGITKISTKVGNGSFVAGIWESGLWNSGWRDDKTVMTFFKIKEFYKSNGSWYVRISGPNKSLVEFSVGDKVSIGNIIAINDNEKRVLLKEYYLVNAIDIEIGFIEIKIDYDFPLMRFEIDSDEHRISISKNIWLDGVFLNGYFKGIWNSGLFNGQPLQTRMNNSTWIDGIFNGGHFYADKKTIIFSGVEKVLKDNIPRLKINFLSNHELTIDDVISIEFYTSKTNIGEIPNKTNSDEPYHLGSTVIIDNDETSITTGIVWENLYSSITVGKIYTTISTGLIQNFEFYSNNISNVTSLQSMNSERVFQYNSWIDVNYSDQSAVNIGRPLTFVDEISKRQYTENNLYGYPTTDVITSLSVFRDSYSLLSRRYELGSRYEIFSDLVGESSNFDEHFESTDTQEGQNNFEKQGWSYKMSPIKERYLKSVSTNIDYGNNEINMHFVGTDGGNNEYVMSMLKKDDVVKLDAYIEIIYKFKTDKIKFNQNCTISSNPLDTPDYTVLKVYGATPSYVDPLWDPQDIPLVRWSIYDLFKISFNSNPGITYSRTNEPLNSESNLQGKELSISANGDGGTLDLIPADDIPGRTNGIVERTLVKNRYSMIDFDLVDAKFKYDYHQNSEGYLLPLLSFGNVNLVNRDVIDNYGEKQQKLLNATYLPVFRNINHLKTHGYKKQEFFFNKQNLLLNIKGNGVLGVNNSEIMLDNLKMYEVSRIPFFQYFKSMNESSLGNINIAIQMPKTTETIGMAPFVEFSDSDTVDNSSSVTNFFITKLISSNVPVPNSINWEKDYIIYRRQLSDMSTPEYYYDSNLNALQDSSGYINSNFTGNWIIGHTSNPNVTLDGKVVSDVASTGGQSPNDINNNNNNNNNNNTV